MDAREEPNVTYAWAHTTDLPAVLTLLEACALPREGVDATLPTLLIARQGEHLVGCAGPVSAHVMVLHLDAT